MVSTVHLLKYYGIQTHTLSWIQAFLTDRTQTVVIDGVTSNTVPVTSGVPQGTLRFDCSVTPRYFAEVTGSRM
jgi:hypothetical protein